MINGRIFNIQKFSIHDGPGIRTTVFFKGCPLSCSWCHNPESQRIDKEVVFYQERCTSCGRCITSCSKGAIKREAELLEALDGLESSKVEKDLSKCIMPVSPSFKEKGFEAMGEGKVVFNRALCDACGECLFICPNNVREIVGKLISKEQLLKEILKDRIFYEQSNGGVTFSGGEPLMQGEFLREILIACRGEGIHTALDTSGFAPIDLLKEISQYVDLFLFDIKLIDEKKHIKYTGVSNKQIHENLRYLTGIGKRVFIRVPIIPGINSSDTDIKALGDFLFGMKIEQVNLIPYHNISMGKYARLSREYSLPAIVEPSEKEMKKISDFLTGYNLNVKIGG